MQFVCYPACSTCRKAMKWLEDNGIAFEQRHIKENNPSAEELNTWLALSGLPVKKLFNTSGMLYRELGLKEKLPAMSTEEQLALLASDGMLVKRPVLVLEDRVLFGFKEDDWKNALLK